LTQEGLEEKRRKVQALRDFQQTGDVKSLTPGLEPKEAALLPGAMMKQQLETGEKAVEFFNLNKKLLTPDMYPEFYQRSIEQFGDLAKNALRPPGSFKDDAEFYAHVWELDNKNAQLKASIEMAKHRFQNVRPGGAVIDMMQGGRPIYQNPVAPGTQQLLLDANNNPYWAQPGGDIRPGTKPYKVGTEKQPTPLSQQDQMIIDGIYAKTGGKYTKEQIAATLPAIKEQSKKTGAEATTGGQVKIDKDKSQAAAADARTDLTKEQLETKKTISTLLQALGQQPGPAVDPNQPAAGQPAPAAPVRPPKPNKSPYELLNKKTNTWMTLTKEQYKALTGRDK